MPINLFGNSSSIFELKIDTSLFVLKPYLRSNYLESDFEKDIHLRNRYRYKNIPDPSSIREPAFLSITSFSKIYVDNIIKTDFDFKDVK